MSIWILIFIVSFIALVKGADILLASSEKIGKAIGLSPFVIGALIIGLGTSLPELASSIAALVVGTTEIVLANVIGSNIANILLVGGLAAVFGRGLSVSKSLIDLDIPLLATSTMLFVFVALDQTIVFWESLLLVALLIIYTVYIIKHPTDAHRQGHKPSRERITKKDILLFFVGAGTLVFGAKYLIDSVIEIALLLDIAVGAVTLVAVALGTSLPELIVSVKAALQGKAEIALGNIFGSNVFNLLLVVGVPGLFATLPLDDLTFTLGLPIMVAASFLFLISGISRKIHTYEGAMYLVFYIFFLGKLFEMI